MNDSSGPLGSLRRAIGRWSRVRRRDRSLVATDFVHDVQRRLPRLSVRTVYDIGAHIGMTALEFSDAWPQAIVYAFEPSARNRQRMSANLVGKPQVRHIPVGMSDTATDSELLFDPAHPSMSRLGEGSGDREAIRLETVDGFSRANGISIVDVMKIDVEGHEMQVLAGAREMLERGAIGVIRIETAVDPDSDYHIQFGEIADHFHPLGYRLFGIYEQSEDALDPGPKLRRFDAAFISPRLVAPGHSMS